MTVEPIKPCEVERRQRIMVDDVFGDPTKQPQRSKADQETDGEVEAQVLAPRETSDELSGARMARPEASYWSKTGDLVLEV